MWLLDRPTKIHNLVDEVAENGIAEIREIGAEAENGTTQVRVQRLVVGLFFADAKGAENRLIRKLGYGK